MKNEAIKQSIISQIEEIGYMNYLNLKKDEINFIDCLPDINFQDKKGISALMWACISEDINVVKKLIDDKADLNLENEDRFALLYATGLGNVEIVKLLIQANADLNAKEKRGNTALMLACYTKNIDVLKVLIEANAKINSTDYKGNTSLMVACSYGYLDIVKILIENNAKIDDTNIHTYSTALMYALHHGHTDIVKYLIEKDVNLDSQAKDGTTALMYAVKNAHLDVVKLLLEAKADINLVDKQGMEALKWAWYHYKLDYDKYVDIVEALQAYKLKSKIFGKIFNFFKRDKINKKIIKIKVYKDKYIKLEDIFNNENVDSKKFNNFFPQRLYPEIENVEYVYLSEFKRFCLANKLDFKIEE